MSDFRFFDVDFEDKEEGDEEEYEISGTDALIFLIDCTQPMFSRLTENEDVPFLLSMKCAHSTFSSKIISSERDLLGIVCFGTQKTENSRDFPHVSVLLDLEQPSAKRILKIEEVTREADGVDKFQTEYGSNGSYSLSDALWVCQTLFANCRIKLTHKRVLLFTCVDDPHPGDTNKQTQARYRARDLEDNDILVELMHLGSYFDLEKFYESLQITNEGGKLPNPSEKLEELLSRVRRRNHKKRSTGRVTLNLGGNVKCGVAVYNLVRPTRIPAQTSLDKRDNTEVKRMTQKYQADTGEELLPSDMMMYQQYSDKRIKFTLDEVRSLKSFGQSGFNLMGFKPISSIKVHHHCGPASFIYHDNISIKGSSVLFTALLDRCLQREVTMFGWWVRSKASLPKMVALLPQKEELDDTGLQLTPPGFHIVPLPFADDFRDLPPLGKNSPRATEDQINAMTSIIKKLRIPNFSPDIIENPVLQTFWANIESLALDRDEVEPIEDCTQPDLEGMDRRTAKLVEEFKDIVFPEGYDPTKAPKRAAGGGTEGGTRKKQREDKYPDVDMRAEATAGTVEKLNVDILKNFLMLQGSTVSKKKKAELVQEVYQHFGVSK